MTDPKTDIAKKRAAWWGEQFKLGMSSDEVLRLNEELITLFPMTRDECEQRAKEMVDVEFVL